MHFLFKFLLITIAVLWLFRVLLRFLAPWALRKAAEKMRDAAAPPPPPQPDGKVRIDYVPPDYQTKKGAKEAGEFVDFEEVNGK